MALEIERALAEHNQAVAFIEKLQDSMAAAVSLLQITLANQGRIFICGNGGSAADAQHFAAELTGRFEKERPGLAAIALTTDTSALTSIGNDYGFNAIYSRQLQGLGQPGDVLIAISTSGNSENVIQAVDFAAANGIQTIGLLGKDGGVLANKVDIPLLIAVPKTARIQEAHICMLHILCEALDG